MNRMNDEPKNWQVTRFCCTSGQCIECRAMANGTKRKRVVQADRLTKKLAETVAKNWSSYDAKASEMPPTAVEKTHG
jgi:hypothetical protein